MSSRSPCNIRGARIHAVNIFHMSMINLLLNLAMPFLTLLQQTSSKVDGARPHLPATVAVHCLKQYITIAISILPFEWDLLLSSYLTSSWQVGKLPGSQQTSQLTRSLAFPIQYIRTACYVIYFTSYQSSFKLNYYFHLLK